MIKRDNMEALATTDNQTDVQSTAYNQTVLAYNNQQPFIPGTQLNQGLPHTDSNSDIPVA